MWKQCTALATAFLMSNKFANLHALKMRSISLKLTLAFMVVGVIGIALVAFVVRFQTQREFDQFVLNQFQVDLIEELQAYYQTNGSWENIHLLLVRNPDTPPADRAMMDGRRPSRFWAPVTLLDENRVVVYGGARHHPGQKLPKQPGEKSVPVEVDGAIVGWVLFESTQPDIAAFPVLPGSPDSPETLFLKNINRAIIFGALGAIALALLLGALLARTIARPIQDLTEATQVIAQGQLGHQVPVRARDEIGRLAESFNQMSSDLADSVQQRRQMTADIAHDLRTPLSVIMGYTESLSDGKLQGSPEMYRVMHNETQHLNRLIEDLRTLSLADAGELPLTKRPTEPLSLLERIAAAHQPLAQQKNIAIEVQAAADLPAINVDTDRMVQVLGNLVNNALRFTPEGGKVILSAQDGGNGRLQLQVSDNGPGIASADLPHIFSRFYRGDKSRVDNGDSGLGLAIVRSIVEAHGGSITAVSTPGEGATFTIDLPLA